MYYEYLHLDRLCSIVKVNSYYSAYVYAIYWYIVITNLLIHFFGC